MCVTIIRVPWRSQHRGTMAREREFGERERGRKRRRLRGAALRCSTYWLDWHEDRAGWKISWSGPWKNRKRVLRGTGRGVNVFASRKDWISLSGHFRKGAPHLLHVLCCWELTTTATPQAFIFYYFHFFPIECTNPMWLTDLGPKRQKRPRTA